MRSGWISTAAKNGASVWKMKEISRRKSTDVLGYVRDAELFQEPASPSSRGLERGRGFALVVIVVIAHRAASAMSACAPRVLRISGPPLLDRLRQRSAHRQHVHGKRR
jgi:hypothetical protein